MIRMGLSHALMCFLVLAYHAHLVDAAERAIHWLEQHLHGHLTSQTLAWLKMDNSQLVILLLAAFCWGVLLHAILSPKHTLTR